VFALGWTPCIGPILATILTKAAADASLSEGLFLLLLYSAGLGLPFIALAIWFDRSARVRRWLGRKSRSLQRIGGFAMIAIGLAYISGVWSTIFAGVQGILARTGWPPI
jgi:cytochrome c-type biogenesis protein